MKSLWISVIFVAAFLVAGNSLSIAQTPEQLYQKGLMKEEGEGKLVEAINLYSQIADNSDADQSLRAKALLHVGLCNEKLGTQEAVEAYQRLVTNFPSQKNEVAIARERLSSLLLIAEKASETPLLPKFTKLEIPTKPGNGVISPDGKKLAYIADNALWSVPVHGKTNPGIAGEPTRLTESMGAWDQANMGIVWSANGKWLAFYATEKGENVQSKDVIYTVLAEGGTPVKVTFNQQRPDISGYDYRMSLSPDGKIVAFVNSDSNNNPVIYTIATNGGSPKKLTGSGSREPSFSPDGNYIAYVQIDPINRLGNEIYVIPSSGGSPVLLSDDSDVVKSPIWSPDGSMIAFLARKYKKGYNNSSNELWIAELDKSGKPTGSISRSELDNSTIFMLAGWSQDHKIGLWLSTPDKTLLYTVPAKGGQSMQITTKGSWIPCWSTDGKYLYFDGEHAGDWAGLESVSVAGGNVFRIPIRSKHLIQPAMPSGGLSVSPDGKKIVFTGSYYDIKDSLIRKELEGLHIMTIPVEGGEPSQLTTNPASDGYPVWSPDGKSIAFIRQENNSEPLRNIYMIPAEGGTPKKVTSESDKVVYGRIDWSPDGERIGFFAGDKTIRIIPIEGGKSKIVVNGIDVHPHNGLSFSDKGDKIAYSDKMRIYITDINNGNPKEVVTGIDAIHTMPSWSPDGEKIAFCAYHRGETDLWFMEDFLPLESLQQNPETTLAEESEGIKIKQIWKSPLLDDLGTVSYDGRWRSCVDWGVGDVALHDLKSGQIRVLTHTASLEDTGSFVLNTAISKNGKQIVSNWWKPNNTTDLMLTDVENSTSEILYSQEGEEVYPSAWLSDHEIVCLRLIPEKRTMQLVTYHTLTKTLQVKKKFDKFSDIQVACSPDEKYIAYHASVDDDPDNLDIYLLPADGDGIIPLIVHPANDRVLGWLPGSKVFLFLSDRSGSWDLWAVKLDETKVVGPAKRIYTDIGEVNPMGFTQNGNCYFGFARRNFYTSLSPFNTETGKIEMGAGKSLEGSNYGVTWSPDGKYIAYLRLDKGWSLNIRNIKTGEERTPSNKAFKPDGFRWSPDGKSLLVVGREENQFRTEGYKGEIFLIDVETGQTDEILQLSDYEYNVPGDDSFPLSRLEWLPDGKSFYFMFYKDRILMHNLETGKDKVLYKYPDFTRGVLNLSPDGTKLLFGLDYPGDKKSRLFTMPTEGGTENEVCSVQEARGFATAFWSRDGKYIYFVEILQSTKTNLWRVASAGGQPEKVWSSENRVEIFDIHPDGDQVAFSIRERKTVVRMIENLSSEIAKVFSENE